MVKEDYKTFAKGTWIDYFMYATEEGAAEWEQTLQYSEILDTYRFLIYGIPDTVWNSSGTERVIR